MTYIEQIPECDLQELIDFIEDYALKLKKQREQKEMSAAASNTKALKMADQSHLHSNSKGDL